MVVRHIGISVAEGFEPGLGYLILKEGWSPGKVSIYQDDWSFRHDQIRFNQDHQVIHLGHLGWWRGTGSSSTK